MEKVNVATLRKVQPFLDNNGDYIEEFLNSNEFHTVATAKFDGICCFVDDAGTFKMKTKTLPNGQYQFNALPCPAKYQLIPGVISNTLFFARVPFVESNVLGQTMELVGPEIKGNKHQLDQLYVILHGALVLPPEYFEENHCNGNWINGNDIGRSIEGLVVHDTLRKKAFKLTRKMLGIEWTNPKKWEILEQKGENGGSPTTT